MEKSTGAQRMKKKKKREENKSHSYIKTFSWHVSASTVMKSKVIWNACCLLSCSSLTTEGLCLGGSPQRGDFLYWDYLTWVGGGGGVWVGEAGTGRCRVQVTAWKLRLVPPTPRSTPRQSILWGRGLRSCEGGREGGEGRERDRRGGEKGGGGVAADPWRG